MPQTTTLCVLAGVAGIALFKWRPVRPILMGSLSTTVYWTFRSWLWGNPGRDSSFWDLDEFTGHNKPLTDRVRWIRFWRFATPLFAPKGFYLYSVVEPMEQIPVLQRSRPAAPLSQRYAETYERDDKDAEFAFGCARIWPAQDVDGRDVMIKFVPPVRCGGEIETHRWLDALKDGFNFSVPVLDYIEFGDATFIVMQRWGHAIDPDFATVEDFVLHGRGALETLNFFHGHHITHADIWASNLLMDVIVPEPFNCRLAGLRGPHRQYALIDFETARVGVQGEEAEQRRKADVSAVGRMLERHLRCLPAQGFVPDLDALLDQMLLEENAEQPTAAAALARYNEICASLSESDLKTASSAQHWNRSVHQAKYSIGPGHRFIRCRPAKSQRSIPIQVQYHAPVVYPESCPATPSRVVHLSLSRAERRVPRDTTRRASSRLTTMPPRRRVAAAPTKSNSKPLAKHLKGKLKLLPEMPLDILFEIFSHLEPLDTLNLSRTTKTLRAHLMTRSSRFIWTAALHNDPDLPPLPDDLTEPAYVNLAFSRHCHVCLASTEFTLWAFRLRLCGPCLEKRRFDDYYKVAKKITALQFYECADLLLQAEISTAHGLARTVSSYEDAESLNEQLLQLKNDEQKMNEFRATRKAFVKKRQDHAFLAVKAGPRRELRKMAERDAAQERRRVAICARLSEIGFDEQVEYLTSSSPKTISDHPLVKSEEVLTDAGKSPKLVELMHQITGKMERRKRKALLKTRQRHLLAVMKEYLSERPLDEINPRVIDFCLMPEIKTLLLDPSKVAYTSEESFADILPELPKLADAWRLSKQQYLLSLLPANKSKNATILENATTFFRCSECNEPIGYPRALVHVCFTTLGHGHRNRDEDDEEVQLYSNLDSEPWDVDERRVSYYPEAVDSAASIVRACGLDESCTTAQEMEDVRSWLECLRCSHKVKGKSVFRWRKAILHDMYHAAAREPVSWRLLDADQAEAAETLEQEGYKTDWSEASDFMCATIGCRKQLSWRELKTHMTLSHGVDDPELDEDYVLHEDASMHQPPFQFTLPHILPKPAPKPVQVFDVESDEEPEVIEIDD
ncbi:F-box domain-containing protein [Mycena chlorophos]|uniref:F-box domain-containing protein n=1 Tax=Mycena chlorophos TaxID=658473 RepID=A0A8H6TVG5_MYCCL|nr:F-box domain-containing protein [Mycena chlorophos]